MESWCKVWREGLQPNLPLAGLLALGRALIANDPRLIQGSTTEPEEMIALCNNDAPVAGACAITFTGWQGLDLDTVEETTQFFARACCECDRKLGEPSACRWFLNWFDEKPRQEVFPELLSEIRTHVLGIVQRPDLRADNTKTLLRFLEDTQ